MGWLVGFIIFVLDVIVIGSVIMGRDTFLHKLVWTLVILIFPVIGLIIYFIFGRSPEDA